jgi:hypothetical protein
MTADATLYSHMRDTNAICSSVPGAIYYIHTAV